MKVNDKAIKGRERIVPDTENQQDPAYPRPETFKRLEQASARETACAPMLADVGLQKVAKVLRAESVNMPLEDHIRLLQQANEHLVIATVRAQMMTEEIQKNRAQLTHLAHHDFLTNLPNRARLNERLQQSIAMAQRRGTKLAVLFLDLDRFKCVNDSLGHTIGDKLLRSVAQRLLDAVRSTDTVSRQGGDEFVVLLSEIDHEENIAASAEKLRLAVTAPYDIAEHHLHIGVSIGISVYPEDGDDAETLVMRADTAMYHAKGNGRGNYQFFRQEMTDRAVERRRLESSLHHALEHKEFELHYQAQKELRTGNIIGAEALIRWRHPGRGLLMPAVFVPAAEDSGAIVLIGRWVLREACRQAQVWLNTGLAFDVVSVNISAAEFRSSDFLANVRAVLGDTGLAPEHLELEVTESVLNKDIESTLATLRALKSLGVRIAIDDFGTGVSSLSYLKQFPIDTLKIDRSFVNDITTNEADDILASAVISIGKSLRRRVIAAGIETHEQLAFLSFHQCTAGQGHYLGRPMIADEFATFLQAELAVSGGLHVI